METDCDSLITPTGSNRQMLLCWRLRRLPGRRCVLSCLVLTHLLLLLLLLSGWLCVFGAGRCTRCSLLLAPAATEPVAPLPCRRRLPHAIIIGARKAGTRALLNMINMHSMVATVKHEVHFFDRAANYGRGLDWYRRQMPLACGARVVVEKTPKYLVHPAAAKRVRRMSRHVRLVLLLREPVDRLLSDITQLSQKRLSLGLAPLSLPSALFQRRSPHYLSANSSSGGGGGSGSDDETAGWHVRESIAPVQNSVYHRHVRLWLRYFPGHQLLVVDSATLVARPAAVMARVERHLRLPPQLTDNHFVYNASKGFYCLRPSGSGGGAGSDRVRCLGSTKGQHHLPLSAPFRRRLRHFFAPHNAKLYRLLGVNYHWPVD